MLNRKIPQGFTTHQSVHGFTLIELLVVISIIAILSIVGMVSYNNFLKSSRDSRREADLKFIQSALEEFHADQLYYPYSITPGQSLTFNDRIYMSKIPSDPNLTPNYRYVSKGANCLAITAKNCTSYCLYSKYEKKETASDNACTDYPPDGYNFGLSRP